MLTEVEDLHFKPEDLDLSATSVTYPVGLGMSFDPWIAVSCKMAVGAGVVIAVNSNRWCKG